MRARSELSNRRVAVVACAVMLVACGGSAARRGGLETLRPECAASTMWDGKRCTPRRVSKALARAKKAMENLETEVALPLLQQAKRAAPHSYREHVAVYELLGIVLGFQERKPEALEAFEMLLSLAPSHLLSYRLSPKATVPFGEARARVRRAGPPSIDLRWPSEPRVSSSLPVDVEVVADPRKFLHRAVIHVRRRGDRGYRALDLTLPKVGKVSRVRVPALDTGRSEVLQLYLMAYDKAGNEVLRWSSAARPREIALRYSHVTPWYRKWWVWAAVGGAVAATTSTAVYFLTREPSDTVGGDFGVR